MTDLTLPLLLVLVMLLVLAGTKCKRTLSALSSDLHLRSSRNWVRWLSAISRRTMELALTPVFREVNSCPFCLVASRSCLKVSRVSLINCSLSSSFASMEKGSGPWSCRISSKTLTSKSGTGRRRSGRLGAGTVDSVVLRASGSTFRGSVASSTGWTATTLVSATAAGILAAATSPARPTPSGFRSKKDV